MPKHKVTAPDGTQFIVTAPEGASESQIREYAQEQFSTMKRKDSPETGAMTFLEPAAAMASAALAEPVAGWAGIVAGPDAVQKTRDALTYEPRTEQGKAGMQAVGEFFQPVGEALSSAETAMGEAGYELAGPVGGAIGETIPTAAMELLGLKGAKAATGTSARAVDKAIDAAAPSRQSLRDAASSLYNEVDNLGVIVKPKSQARLYKDLQSLTKEGMDEVLTPKSHRAMTIINERLRSAKSLSEVEELRRIASKAAETIDPSDKRVAVKIVEKIDDFMDRLDGKDVLAGDINKAAGKIKQARSLWQRASKAKKIERAFERAAEAASGPENGLRNEISSLLKNEKAMRGFTDAEKTALRRVSRGTAASNLYKFLGKFGFSEQRASQMIGASVGATGGYAIGGPVGAIAVPVAGTAFKRAARALTEGNAKFAESLLKAGKDGREITMAYLKNTPKAKRNVEDLTALLLNAEKPAALAGNSNKLVADAAALATVLAIGAPIEQGNNQ